MADQQHRATDLQWVCIKSRASDGNVAYSTILELLHRIEALEVAAKPNHPEKPDSSLVERVADAMDGGTEWQARAAIREVAAWLRKHKQFGAAVWSQRLKEEAEL